MAIKKSEVRIFIFMLIFKVLLDVSYVKFININFEYMGFINDFNIWKYVVSFITFFVLYLFLPKKSSKPSYVFYQLHLIIIIIPMMTIYAFMNESSTFYLFSVFVFLLQLLLIRMSPNIRIVKLKHSKKILYLIILSISVFVYGSMIRKNGLPSLNALNLLNVYDVRSSVVYPFLMSYLVNWQAKVINPFIIVTSYQNRNKKLLLLGIALQLLIFLLTGHKTYIFMPIAIIFIIKVLEKNNFLNLGTIAASAGTLISLLIYKLTNSIVLPSFFIRRFLFVPAQIKFFYYDFFTKNPFLYYSMGLFGRVFGIDYPYQMRITNIIGDVYYDRPSMWVNTGYLADAYANGGLVGMVFISILLVFIFKLIDSLSTKIGKELTIGISLYSVLSLNDGSLQTILLTGGFLFLLIVLYLYSITYLKE